VLVFPYTSHSSSVCLAMHYDGNTQWKVTNKSSLSLSLSVARRRGAREGARPRLDRDHIFFGGVRGTLMHIKGTFTPQPSSPASRPLAPLPRSLTRVLSFPDHNSRALLPFADGFSFLSWVCPWGLSEFRIQGQELCGLVL
jgi:hypothetical protein